MPVWTEDDGSTTNYLDKQVDLDAGTTYRIRNSSSTDLFTIVESTGAITSLGGLTVSGDVNGASASEMAHLSGLSTNIVTALAGKADKTNVLELDNTTSFTPTADHHPATKKYVLDNAGGAGGTDWTLDQTGSYTFNSANIPSGSSHYATSTQGSTADTAVQPGDTLYIGTTSIAHNRGTAALTLAGITLTTPDLGTPTALVGTNISGTAANLTVGATTGVAAGATANATDANLKARANHTGTQLAATISDFNSAVTTAVGAVDNVSVANLETKLGDIDTSITIGSSTDIDTTISGELIVTGSHITGGTILNLKSNSSMNFVIDQDDDETGLQFAWWNKVTEIASLSEAGNLQIDGDLTVSGNKITFGGDGIIEQETSTAALSFGNENGYVFTALTGAPLDIYLRSDANEDNADQWKLSVADAGQIDWYSYASGSYVTKLTLDTNGNLTVPGTVNGIDIATDVAANSAKNTNVPTALSIGTASNDVVNITSDGGTDDVTIPTATTGNAGVMSKTIYDQWFLNTAHVNSTHAPTDSLSKSAGGTMGADINMADNAIGFTQFEPTYNSSDTEVHFDDYGNKAFATFGAGNITDLNLYFPDFSCNCVLLLKQDTTGSRTVTNFKTFDQADGNQSTVQFAGGSNPTLTTAANKIDIISFYWDNDNHKAYGTITKNF